MITFTSGRRSFVAAIALVAVCCGTADAHDPHPAPFTPAKGHHLVEPMGQTSANSIAVTPDGLLGAPDLRIRGSEAAGNQLA